MSLLTHTKVTQLDYTFEDKNGRIITFEYLEDCEGPNRGYVVDLLNAYAGDEKVGFLQTIYQSSEKFEEFFPSGILNYIDQVAGKSMFQGTEGHGNPSTDLRRANPDVLSRTAKRLADHNIVLNLPEVTLESYNEFQAWFQTESAKSRVFKGLKAGYEHMLRSMDQHTVDFIGTEANSRRDIPNDNQGLGIAAVLYKVMAKEIAKKGHRLHAGYYQHPAADAIWQKMLVDGIAQVSTVFVKKYATETSPAEMRLTIDPDTYELASDTTPRMKI